MPLFSACCMLMFYLCTKLRENISRTIMKSHRRRKVLNNGGGGQALEYRGGGQALEYRGGGKGGQIPSRHMTSYLRRCDVTTSHRRHFDVMCPLVFNQSVPDNYISPLKI